MTERTREAQADAAITADNRRHFGTPVYEYDMSQGIEDGYLAACEIVRRDIFLDEKPSPERETGVDRGDLLHKSVVDAITGELVSVDLLKNRYDASSFEGHLLMPDRVAAMTRDLFGQLLATGGPEQKTIVFCARDRHADDVATALNNLTRSGAGSRAGRASSRTPSSARPRSVGPITWRTSVAPPATTSSPPPWTS